MPKLDRREQSESTLVRWPKNLTAGRKSWKHLSAQISVKTYHGAPKSGGNRCPPLLSHCTTFAQMRRNTFAQQMIQWMAHIRRRLYTYVSPSIITSALQGTSRHFKALWGTLSPLAKDFGTFLLAISISIASCSWQIVIPPESTSLAQHQPMANETDTQQSTTRAQEEWVWYVLSNSLNRQNNTHRTIRKNKANMARRRIYRPCKRRLNVRPIQESMRANKMVIWLMPRTQQVSWVWSISHYVVPHRFGVSSRAHSTEYKFIWRSGKRSH